MIEVKLSELNRVVSCPGSYLMPKSPHEGDRTAANEGILAHNVAEKALAGHSLDLDELQTEFGLDVTYEMQAAARDYLLGIEADASEEQAEVLVEFTVPSPNEMGLKGRLDCALWLPLSKTLIVYEFKYGHRAVEVKENYQLTGAALCLPFEPDRVVLKVFQPRAFDGKGDWRTHELSLDDLIHAKETILYALGDVRAKRQTKRTGLHCRNCKALFNCIEARQTALSLIEETNFLDPEEIPREALGWALHVFKDAKEFINSIEKALCDFVEGELREGRTVDGWAIQARPGRRSWSGSIDEMKAVGQMLGFPLTKEVPVTLTEAEKRGGKAAEPLLKKLISTGSPSMQLAPVNPENTLEVFENAKK